MFDRIAGVYDLMNTAMTAGLHHRWRARAADAARVGPGSRVLDVATGTGDLAIELARRVSPGRRGRRQRLRRGHARARARQGSRAHGRRCGRASSGATRWRCPTRTTPSTPRRSASARATSPTSQRGLAEMARVVRPGGRVVVLEITTPTRPPLSLFYRALVRPHRPGARARSRARRAALRARSRRQRARRRSPTPTPTCPNSVKRFPAPGGARGGDGARGPVARSATCSPPAASSRSTPARFPRGQRMMSTVRQHEPSSGRRGRAWTGSRRSCAAAARACASGWCAPSCTSSSVTARGRRAARLARQRDGHRGRQAAAPAARGARRRVGRRTAGDADGEERLVRAAVAVELVHSATLVHDDLIDGAQLRRGHPTVAAVAGRRVAVATGRPAVLAGVRRARAQRGRGAAARPVGRELGARRRRAAAARGRLRGARRRRALPAGAAS